MKVFASDVFTIPSPPIGPAVNRFGSVGEIISTLLNYVIPLAGIVMMLMLIAGGFELMTSGGSQEGVASGKSKITLAIIGFFVVFLSWFIIRAIEAIFGISILG